MASNVPEWNQAPRAHQQIKDGSSISNSFAHGVVRTIFQKNEREQNTIHKIEFADQKRASICVILAENNTFRLDAYLHVFLGRIRVRPDALLHSRNTFILKISDSESECRVVFLRVQDVRV